MFTLRRITGDRAEINDFIGESYTFIGRERSPKLFAEIFKDIFKKDQAAFDPKSEEPDNRVYAFVVYFPGTYRQALYANQEAYIMTSGGETFANVSFK